MGPRRDAFFTELPFATDQCERNLWASFALVHNLLPMGGCFSITWSLAVQMQFYACFPVLLVLLRPCAPGFRHAPVCGNMLPFYAHQVVLMLLLAQACPNRSRDCHIAMLRGLSTTKMRLLCEAHTARARVT